MPSMRYKRTPDYAVGVLPHVIRYSRRSELCCTAARHTFAAALQRELQRLRIILLQGYQT